MWCSRGCLGPHATSVACLWHVSVVGGARRRGCAAGGVSVIFNRLLGPVVVDDLDVVSIGVQDERPVVPLVIGGALSGRAVVRVAGGGGGLVERVHLLVGRRGEGDVDVLRRLVSEDVGEGARAG